MSDTPKPVTLQGDHITIDSHWRHADGTEFMVWGIHGITFATVTPKGKYDICELAYMDNCKPTEKPSD